MASFGALVSLQTTIHTLRDHPNPPISLDNHQADSLLQNGTFLQEFLELYSHRELYSAQDLDSLIKSAAYAAEDVIESYIVDRIGGSTRKGESINDGDIFYQDLQKVVEEMDRIKKKAMEIKKKLGDEDHESGSWAFDASPTAVQSLKRQDIVVGFEVVLEDLLGKLIRERKSSRQIIPIVGMGGIGKTTLALKAFEYDNVENHFDIRVWVTISQKFKTRYILVEVLCQRGKGSKKTLSQLSELTLGGLVHKELFGRRYLVVLDDMWSIDAWDEINRWFPDNKNGSVVMVTTRISNLALQLTNSTSIKLNQLDEDKSWELFKKTVFKEDGCPSELEKIGKTIVKNCRGLPLSIVVIGALLAKSKQTKRFWEYIARNLSPIVNLENDEQCMKSLSLSYRHLPVHLKSCFLYMGIFGEDERIHVSWVVKLLAAEGFLKPIDGTMMEDVAEKYINDLVERNLIIVDEWGSTGKVKSCKMHDLLRDLCIREAHKDNFLCHVRKHKHSVIKRILGSVKKFLWQAEEDNDCWYLNYESGLDAHRRILVRERGLKDEYPHHQQLSTSEESASSLVRSIIISDLWEEGITDLMNLRMLRVLTGDGKHRFLSIKDDSFMRHAFHFYNARYIAILIEEGVRLRWSSIVRLWNLQTLIIASWHRLLTIPIEIWKLPQLQHLEYSWLLDPPRTHDDGDNFVLQNLTSLSCVFNFKSSEVVIRIPNIKKLNLQYDLCEYMNLEQLEKLEHLHLCLRSPKIEEARPRESLLIHSSFAFPHSLKKLYFSSHEQLYNWDEVTTAMGALPNLEKLVLQGIKGTEWRLVTETETEARFSSLKVLSLSFCQELRSWTIDDTHFRRLERLSLKGLYFLSEIPSEIGDIPNLQSIRISSCRDSSVESAKRIAEEQEDVGNTNLQVSVTLGYLSRHLESLASANFKVKFLGEEEEEA